MLGAMGHAHALQSIGHALLAVSRIHAAIGQRQFDVFIDGEVTNQIKALKDETDFAVAYAGALRQRKVLDRIIVEHVFAFRRRVQQA